MTAEHLRRNGIRRIGKRRIGKKAKWLQEENDEVIIRIRRIIIVIIIITIIITIIIIVSFSKEQFPNKVEAQRAVRNTCKYRPKLLQYIHIA